MINDSKTAVIICAGGIGDRMGAGMPKQFIEMDDGMSILRKTVDAFRDEAVSDLADVIVVTAPAGFEKETDRLANEGVCGGEHAHVIAGGKERQDSVRNALLFLDEKGFCGNDIVLIHDGARPYVTAGIIRAVADAVCEHKAAITAVPVKDTIRDSESGTLDRSRLYSVQTPQGFRFGLIRDAVEQAYEEGFYGTDDGSLAERAGVMPVIVAGSYANIKITTPEDLRR